MINLKYVTKKYGKSTAIKNMSLSIPESGIYCLLGRNGAGKTTLMKMLAGHIPATEGKIAVDNKKVSPGNMPEAVSYIESGSVQFNMRISTLIEMASKLHKDFDQDFANKMVKRFELDPRKRFAKLSFGMKTMLTTILTLANQSKVVLLDEPTLGFDAIMRNQFNALLLESYQNNPRVIIVSTHLIDEIAKVIERLIVIDKGNLLLEAALEDIDEMAYTLSGASKDIIPLIQDLNCIGQTTAGSVMAAHIYGPRITPPEGIAIDRISLQDFFINLVGGNSHE
ncbi:MAG: ABC transporter ATP-binding protein [Defluviitaleaceae bacterium]|nr:ABC transporter ATP-binding protein [Defluviitaleaceae bacterium]